MRQRLLIAAALLGDKQILLFDEPTNALDEDGQDFLARLLLRTRARPSSSPATTRTSLTGSPTTSSSTAKARLSKNWSKIMKLKHKGIWFSAILLLCLLGLFLSKKHIDQVYQNLQVSQKLETAKQA